ncbi:hypothetical protein MC885_016435 [Smutsia gigantea]|nr:hypothetical protein MC885_016435 [Smutsia gigantea]
MTVDSSDPSGAWPVSCVAQQAAVTGGAVASQGLASAGPLGARAYVSGTAWWTHASQTNTRASLREEPCRRLGSDGEQEPPAPGGRCRIVDTPGFIVNRLLVPYLMEAIRLFERASCEVKLEGGL